MPQVVFAIPARFGSSRLPGKPLLDLGGKTVIERVVERAQRCAEALRGEFPESVVLVATDDRRIAEVAERASVRAVLTSPELPSGTDRIHAAVESLAPAKISDDALVLNIQGDEPFFSVADVVALARAMHARPEIPMGTLAFERSGREMFLKSNVVKVVTDRNGLALWFSRAPIPWPRAAFGATGADWGERAFSSQEPIKFLHHIGVYAFRRAALTEFAQNLPPSELEVTEGLEQLRALEAGWKLLVVRAQEAPHGIDTPEDLEAARLHLHSEHQ